jgi:uncharacterized membrane protein HdeD (DUF308 family)
VSKDAIYLTLKTLVASSYDREDFIYGKRLVVMPLDIAMQCTTKAQLMSTILIIFCVLGAVTIATAFDHLAETQFTVPYILYLFFSIAGHYLLLNSQFLAIVHIIVYSGAIMILYSPSC